MRRTLLAIALTAALLAGTSVGTAATSGDTSHSPSTATHKPSTKKPTVKTPSSDKTVHVKGYRRKDGTYVAPHTRRPPK